MGSSPRSRLEPDARAGSGLAALPSIERQVLLLTFLEEFSIDGTASIVASPSTSSGAARPCAPRCAARVVGTDPDYRGRADDRYGAGADRSLPGPPGLSTARAAVGPIDLASRRSRSNPCRHPAQGGGQRDPRGPGNPQEVRGACDLRHRLPRALLTGEMLEPAFVIPKPFSPRCSRLPSAKHYRLWLTMISACDPARVAT